MNNDLFTRIMNVLKIIKNESLEIHLVKYTLFNNISENGTIVYTSKTNVEVSLAWDSADELEEVLKKYENIDTVSKG